MFRFLDLKPFGPVCGSSTCVRDAVDKFDDVGGVKKEKKRRMKKDDSDSEMYMKTMKILNCTSMYSSLGFQRKKVMMIFYLKLLTKKKLLKKWRLVSTVKSLDSY